MYEVINQELGVYSCNIADLTEGQKEGILKRWSGNYPIEKLAMLTDVGGSIILNKECEGFEMLKEVVSYYMTLNNMQRIELKEKASFDAPSVKQVLDSVDNALSRRKAKRKKNKESV